MEALQGDYSDGEQAVPAWDEQITARGVAVSAVLGSLFCLITISRLSVAAGLLGFFLVKSWTALVSRLGFSARPFTRQENTVIQTCVVARYGIAASGN